MKKGTLPPEKPFTTYSDLGFLGIEKLYLGVISRKPDKKSKGRELTQEQKRRRK